jgi:hypothetical protein
MAGIQFYNVICPWSPPVARIVVYNLVKDDGISLVW